MPVVVLTAVAVVAVLALLASGLALLLAMGAKQHNDDIMDFVARAYEQERGTETKLSAVELRLDAVENHIAPGGHH